MLSVCLFRAILSSNSRNSCASITVSLCLLGAKTYCHTTRKTDQNSKLESCIDASNATPQEKKGLVIITAREPPCPPNSSDLPLLEKSNPFSCLGEAGGNGAHVAFHHVLGAFGTWSTWSAFQPVVHGPMLSTRDLPRSPRVVASVDKCFSGPLQWLWVLPCIFSDLSLQGRVWHPTGRK